MSALWSSRSSAPPEASGAASTKPAGEAADPGVADIGPEHAERPAGPVRPILQRNQSAAPPAVPPPPNQPPPPPGNVAIALQQQQQQQQPQQPPDSLSLAQLRRIVADFPRSEPIAYDFVYEDQGPLGEEIDEWFVDQFWQWVRLNAAHRAFEYQWQNDAGKSTAWDDADEETRNKFVTDTLAAIGSPESKNHSNATGQMVYLILGRWMETAGSEPLPGKFSSVGCVATQPQLDAIKASVLLVAKLGGVPIIWKALTRAFEPFWSDDVQQLQPGALQEAQDELMNLMTIMYMMIQETLDDLDGMAEVSSGLLRLQPNLVQFFSDAVARLRWDDAGTIPQAQVFLLFWKSILLVFGGSKELAEVKKETREPSSGDKDKDTITASPLDYHVFRQEITSKYPAYIPPQPAIPLEAENTSLLPPLPNQVARNNGANGILPAPPNAQSGGASILHQPVHIATPAPSPPPSPGVGGKGGKKQNYQTNQNFPFMYPPLDASSNNTGGKGNAALQDMLVGRRWEGSDVPASILEAGELFSQRVRTTRATRQLWEERERFMKFERGWEAPDDDLIDELDLSDLTLSEKEELGLLKKEEKPQPAELTVDYGPRGEELDEDVKRRLNAVELYYSESLPTLQSVVITLLKAILSHYTVLMNQSQAQQTTNAAGQANPRANGGAGPNGVSGQANGDSPLSPEDADAARTREITAKAVTGILLLLLKWFKVSHVLKFEYLTQLLLDCNYLPLCLKLFAHQDVQQVVESKPARIDANFFYFCNLRAGAGENPANPADEAAESEDEAAPPPIKRRRSPPRPSDADAAAEAAAAARGQAGPPSHPEVDELGYPVSQMPVEPITDFSRRNFFSLINYLRIMQKVCKGKAHRNLLLVHYKSSQLLRKNLKVPQPELRLYTLKLFKGQVPYCGRKWRQSNMRVITAVYLHCRPELRDEWLAGSDVDAEVEESLPLEQALRSLTHWFNVRRYPDKMAPEVRAALREEQDFFVRELDKLDVNWAEVGPGGDEAGSEWGEASGWG